MSLRKKPRLSEEEQALQNERNRIAREARLANIFPPQPPTAMSPPITPPKAQSPKAQSPKAQSRRTSPAQSPKTSSSSSSSSSSSASANMIEEERCALCLESLKNSNTYKTQCKHQYHEDCYDKIIDEKCPLCREPLDKESRKPVRPPDMAHMDQLVQINPEILEYIENFERTVEGDRLYHLAYDILDINPYVTLRELRFMIFAATGNPTHTAPDLLESLDSDSDFGSVYSGRSPVGSISSRRSPVGSISSRNSPASSVSSRSSPVGSISSRSSRGSTAASELPYYFSSDDDDDLYPPHPISSSMASNASSSSSSIRPPPMSSSSNSNRVTARKKTNRVVRNPSPPVSINVGDDDEWIKSLYKIQDRGESRKRGRKGGKSKRKNNKKNSRKTSRSR
jgi:hypothetical protein